MKDKLVVIGAGGHARVVIATARAAGFEVTALYDDDPALHGGTLAGVRVLGPVAAVRDDSSRFVLAIGSNRARKLLDGRMEGLDWATVVHPAAIVHESVCVEAGSVIFAGAIVQPESRIGRHAILNTRSSVDHDCHIGDYVHLAPGSTLAGEVSIGEGTMLGIGSCAIPQVNIGEWSVIAAGAAVTADIGDRVLAAGVPATVKKGLE